MPHSSVAAGMENRAVGRWWGDLILGGPELNMASSPEPLVKDEQGGEGLRSSHPRLLLSRYHALRRAPAWLSHWAGSLCGGRGSSRGQAGFHEFYGLTSC